MATVIKSNGARSARPALSAEPIAFSLEDMSSQANRYLEKVRQEAAKIIQEANQQTAEHRQRAEEEGRQAAHAAADQVLDQKIASQMETLLPALRAATDGIEESRQQWIQHWQTTAVKLATTIAEKIIRREVEKHPEITLDLVRESLSLAAGSSEITLSLHPTDHQNLGPQAEKLAAEICRLAPSSVVADPSIEPGGCRVDTQFGSIDPQFSTQLERIEQELLD